MLSSVTVFFVFCVLFLCVVIYKIDKLDLEIQEGLDNSLRECVAANQERVAAMDKKRIEEERTKISMYNPFPNDEAKKIFKETVCGDTYQTLCTYPGCDVCSMNVEECVECESKTDPCPIDWSDWNPSWENVKETPKKKAKAKKTVKKKKKK